MPLLSVYNHLIQGYVMMRQNRFDTHKRSELKDVYQSIRKLTSEQPLYKINFDESAQNYTLGIKDSAIFLSSIIKELNIDDGTSVFQSKVPASSRPDLVDVSVLEGSDTSDFQETLKVDVHSIAAPQKNSGYFLPDEDAPLPAGQYNFVIGVEENRYSFQFKVTNTSTNLEMQTKLSDFINKSSVGLYTQVVHHPELGVSRLELTSKYPGTSKSGTSSFTLEDTRRPSDASKGIIEHLGLDQVVDPPVNTTFSINGRKHETRNTDYIYDKKLSISFLSSTDQPVTLAPITDQGPVLDKINDFVTRYNSMLDFVKTQGAGNHRSGKLLYDLTSVARQHKDALAKHGIDIVENNHLSVDHSVISEAAVDGSLEQFLTEEGGFANTLIKKLSQISINPMDYLDKIVVTYPNTAAKKTFSPYVTSIYSGLLYNNYC